LRKFGTGASERNHLVSWLQQHPVREVVMESTSQYCKPGWLHLERLRQMQLLKMRLPGSKADASLAETGV